MYSLCTFRFLRSGRAQLRPARDVSYHPAKSQRGIVLIAAIFLLVVIAALGGFMLTIGSLSNSASALDIEGAKAYQASRAGIEWGAYQVLRNSVPCSPSTSTSFSPGGTLSSFTVTVTCDAASYSELGASTTVIYTLISTACNRPSAGNCPGSAGDNYVERQLQVTLDK
jgi:MSHA biogenesis protein MshP